MASTKDCMALVGISEANLKGTLVANYVDMHSTLQRLEDEVRTLLNIMQNCLLGISHVKKTLTNLSSSFGEVP